MLTALEAFMNGCHSVGCLLPEVQKCCLKTEETVIHILVSDSYISNAVSLFPLCLSSFLA